MERKRAALRRIRSKFSEQLSAVVKAARFNAIGHKKSLIHLVLQCISYSSKSGKLKTVDEQLQRWPEKDL